MTSWTEFVTSQPLFQNRPKVANFVGIIKIATTFIKKDLKGSEEVKRIRNYVLKRNLYL